MHKSRARKKDPLSVTCTGILFGSVVSPSILVALGVLRMFPPRLSAVALPALAVSTAVLFGVFIRESRVETALRRRIGRLFPLFEVPLIAVCLFVNYALLAVLANFTLLTLIDYWFVLVVILGVSSVLSVIAVTLLPASRLEAALSAKLGKESSAHRWYRVGAYVLLALAVVFSCWIWYGYFVAEPGFPG